MNIVLWGLCGLLCVWQVLEACLFLTKSRRIRLTYLYAAAAVFVLGGILCATLLAVLGLYSLYACCVLLLALLALARVMLRVRWGMPLFTLGVPGAVKQSLRRPALATLSALLVVAMAGALYVLFPTNYLFGGRDYGLYEINAVHVSQTGSYQYESDDFYTERYEDVEGFVKLAYPALFNAKQLGISEDVGKLDPQFLPMVSAGMAVYYDLLGFTGLLRFSAIVSALSLLTVFLFARYLFGKNAALLATLFMAVCPAQLWAARIAGSEPIAQWLFLLAAWCLAIGWRRGHTGWLALAGACIGIGCFNRIDNYVLLIALYGTACYCLLYRPRLATGMAKAVAVATLVSAASVWYCYTFHYYYFMGRWDEGSLKWLLFGCAAALGVFLLVMVFGKALARGPNPLALACGRVPAAVIAGGLGLLFLYAYFVRPMAGTFSSRSMVEFSWYISALAVPMAIVGLYALLRQSDLEAGLEPAIFFVLCGLGSMVMYTINPAVAYDHFWAGRRWVPVNNPFLLLMAAVGIAALWQAGRKAGTKKLAATGARVLSAGCAVVMAGYMGWQCRLFATTTMFAGVNGQYAALAEALPDDALVITGEQNIASVLKYVYNKPVYLWNSSQEEIDATIERGGDLLSNVPLRLAAAERYLEKYGEFYIVGTPGRFWQVGAMEKVYDSVLAADYPEMVIGSYPKALGRWEIDVAVYRVTPSDAPKSYDFLRGQIMGRGATRDADWNISLDFADTVFYGPYTSLYAGSYRLEIDLEGDDNFAALLNIQLEEGTYIVTEQRFTRPGTYVVEFSFDTDKNGLEFALINEGTSLITCTRLELFEVVE